MTPGGALEGGEPGEGRARFSLAAGPAGTYRLAQWSDYAGQPRGQFPWVPPARLRLRARVSPGVISGTWGFGWWNNPFSFELGFGGTRRFPALPNAAWFFFASPPNYLSFRDDLPAQGFFAGAFRSPALPLPVLGLLAPGLPLLAIPLAARLLRPLLARVIRQDARALPFDPTEWHTYELLWEAARCTFTVDGGPPFVTPVSPRGPLGLVLWLDNQYAALPPSGRLRFGTLETPEEVWMEVEGVEIVCHPV